MSITERLDRFQQKHPGSGFPLAVIYKYVDDSGGYLAALITYYAFISIFPLLLLASTVLGFVLMGDTGLQTRILDSALQQFPVVGDQLADPRRLGGGTLGLVIGILGSLYGALGVAQAAQYAMNTAWHVPRHSRPNPFSGRGRSLILLGTAGVAIISTTALSTVGGVGGTFGNLAGVVVVVGSVLINFGVFLMVFRIATTRALSVRDVLPGALTAALVWQLLQSFGIVYVQHVIRHASATNGVFALVLGLLAFLYLSAVVVVLCVEINVVLVDKLYPRSLLTPFTDNVLLTQGDRDAYSGQATAQSSKGFQDVDVSFDQPVPHDRQSDEQ